MPTLATMKARIATELERDDLSAEIADAINDAIAEHERRRFWFNQSRALTFDTVAAQRAYGLADASWIPNVIEIDRMFVTISGQNRPLLKVAPGDLEELNDTTATSGEPSCWGYIGTEIILYPTPADAYTVRAVAHYRLAALADGDSNAWTTEAEALIRRQARQFIRSEIEQDHDGAAAIQPLIDRALGGLLAETSRRAATGRIRPTSF